MVSMQELINANSVLYYNPSKNTLPSEYITRESLGKGNWLTEIYPMIGTNNYRSGSEYNNYPSYWRGVIGQSVRSLDEQEQSLIATVLSNIDLTNTITNILPVSTFPENIKLVSNVYVSFNSGGSRQNGGLSLADPSSVSSKY